MHILYMTINANLNMYKNDHLRMYTFDYWFDILLANLGGSGLFCKRIINLFKIL